MARLVRFGVIVPSSNTALEPLTSAIVESISDAPFKVSVHFTRIRVTKISLGADSDAQFDVSQFLSAARLLADADVNVIGWSGTSAGWLGFDTDIRLGRAIEEEVGITCTTSTLALNKILGIIGARSFALVTPYTKEMNEAIRSNYASIGIDIPRNQTEHLGVTENKAIAKIDESILDRMVNDVAKEGAHVVSTFCTNLVAAQRAKFWEEKHDVVVLDSVATVVWDMLRIANVPAGVVKGWGKLFTID